MATLKWTDGKLYEVPEDRLAQAQKDGFQPVDPVEAEAAQHPVRAFVEGAARGATLGFSDNLEHAFGAPVAEIKARKEVNPVASTFGTLTGGVGLGLATGGTSSVAGAALEGGLYGLGSAVNEDALDNKPLTTERLAASILGGALAGGGAQAGFNLLSKGVSAGVSKLGGKSVQDALHSGASAIEANMLKRAPGAAIGDLASAGGNIDEVVQFARKAKLSVRHSEDAIAGVRKAFDAAEEKLALKAKHLGVDVTSPTMMQDLASEAALANPGVKAEVDALLKTHRSTKFLKDALESGSTSSESILSDALTPGNVFMAASGHPGGLGLSIAASASKRAVDNGIASTAMRNLADGAVLDGVSKGLAGRIGQVLSVAPQVLGASRVPLELAAAKGTDALVQEHMRIASGPGGEKYLSNLGLPTETPEEVDAVGKKLAILESIAQHGAAHDELTQAAVEGMFGSAPGRKGALSGSMSAKQFTATKASMDALRREPSAAFEAVPGDFRVTAPGVTGQATAKMMEMVQYLHDKAPKSPYEGMPPALQQDWKPSAAELDKFSRVKDAVTSPASVLKAMAQGYIAPEQVEAIRSVYPAIYEDLQQKLSERLMMHKKPLTYQQKLALSTVLGGQALSMSPAQAQILQQSHAQAAGAEAAKSGTKGPDGRQSADVAKNTQTQAQRLASR